VNTLHKGDDHDDDNNNNINNNHITTVQREMLLLQPAFGSVLILFFSEMCKISGKAFRELNNGMD
jgi:hypothetical protein